jgi:hypothetical protein
MSIGDAVYQTPDLVEEEKPLDEVWLPNTGYHSPDDHYDGQFDNGIIDNGFTSSDIGYLVSKSKTFSYKPNPSDMKDKPEIHTRTYK